MVLAALAMAACSTSGSGVGQVPAPGAPSASAAPSSPAAGTGAGDAVQPEVVDAPELAVEVVTDELEHGWGIGFLPDGRVLVSERPARLTLLSSARAGATVTRVEADLSQVRVGGEGGLLDLLVHPDFPTSREFTTCQNHQVGGTAQDIRLVTWRLSRDGSSASRVRDLLTGLPVASGGRHSGCRMALDDDGALIVGTGDTAVGSVPQDLGSLGGKTLRLDLATGEPLPDNPFIDAADPAQRYVTSFGHRNIQGVAVRPGTGQVYTAEHGPRVNDEVNLIRPGANYGWDPSAGGTTGSYDESVPMTDLDAFPDAVPAVWQSGSTTQAVCSATFLDDPMWGEANGSLVVTALKGAKLILLGLDDAGAVRTVAIPEQTNAEYGRLRASTMGPDGALYVTTTNGEDDRLLRITPRP